MVVVNWNRHGFGFYGVNIPWKGWAGMFLIGAPAAVLADKTYDYARGPGKQELSGLVIFPIIIAGGFLMATNFEIIGLAAKKLRGK